MSENKQNLFSEIELCYISEISINDFEDINKLTLHNKDNFVIVIILKNCIMCQDYIKALQKNKIPFKIIIYNQNNLGILKKIAKYFKLSTLLVPFVLIYKNGILHYRHSNKIQDIHLINNLIN